MPYNVSVASGTFTPAYSGAPTISTSPQVLSDAVTAQVRSAAYAAGQQLMVSSVEAGAGSSSTGATTTQTGNTPTNLGSGPPDAWNAVAYGIDNTGATDVSAALIALASRAIAANKPLYLPDGTYRLNNTLDFTTLTGIPAGGVPGWAFIMAPTAILKATSNLGGNAMVKLQAPGSGQFYGCTFRFGIFDGSVVGTGNGPRALQFHGINDSEITVTGIHDIGNASALIVDSSSAAQTASNVGTFNNYIKVGYITRAGFGLATLGQRQTDTNGLYGFQGNEVHLVHLTDLTQWGVYLDINQAPNLNGNSCYNHFFIGPIERCAAGAITDPSGYNIWDVRNENSCPAGTGFVVPNPGGLATSVVRGYFPDGVAIGGGQAMQLVDDGQPVGAITGSPAVPASGTAVYPYSVNAGGTYSTGVRRPVAIYVSGGTGVSVSVNGYNLGVGSGMFIVPVGGNISITYTAAPTWKWIALPG